MTPIIRISAALLALSVALVAQAQARFYEVEMLVFKHQDSPFAVDETFARGDLPSARASQVLGLDASLVDGNLTLVPYGPGERTLLAEADRLQAQGNSVLFHERWLHGLMPKGQDRPIRITGGRDLGFGRGFELDGYVNFSIAKFIESEVDLAVQYIVDGAAEGPVTPRLTETRRARSGVIHYLDHPTFGVLLTYARTDIE
ncbi:CsiV family protein [Litorivicinus lipolyticus]|uniref:CsiV family protein n=1 Tax=Litorivicinus lipolyticus TaxID=418701 RepID=UPI003B58C700